MYAVVDIETTGGNSKFGKITEIAIYIHDGLKLIDQFVSLVNPECTIPQFITNLTGITNEMVKTAPKFYEVAKKVVEMTENKIFVAHNVGFDYGFMQQEFKSLGYHYERDTLCTVRLSKKILPGLASYSLGKVCASLGIEIKGRHRAGGDAFATTRLMEILFAEDQNNHFSSLIRRDVLPNRLNDYLSKERIYNLPEETGIYYFRDNGGEVIYIGKSKNIRSRVKTHFLKATNTKSRRILDETGAVDFEITGSELLALLRESEEIKKHQPRYNVKQRRTSFRYALFSDLQIDGVLRLNIRRTSSGGKPFGKPFALFSTKEEASNFLFELVKKHRLCPQKTGFERDYTGKPCFHHSIQLCNGVCTGLESVEHYNERVIESITQMDFEHTDFLIVDRGRHRDEKTVIKVENGQYRGFGFASGSHHSLDSLKDCTGFKQANKEETNIIRSYLKKNAVENILRF